MTTFVHTCKVRVVDAPEHKYGRRLVPLDDGEFRRLCMRYDPGEILLLGTKEVREKHSPQSRGYYRGVVLPFVLQHMGFEISRENLDLLHIKMKDKFGPVILKFGKDGPEGEVFSLPKSQRDYDQRDQQQLCEGVIRWAAEFLGVTVPPPEKVIIDGAGI